MLTAPVVGVVDDAGGLVGFHLVAVDEPFEAGAGAEPILVHGSGNVTQREVAVVDDGLPSGLVLPPHLGDAIQLPLVDIERMRGLVERVGIDRLVVDVQIGKCAADIDERLEVSRRGGQRDARQHPLEIGGEHLPVLLGVQHPVDVVEDVILAHLRPELLPVDGEDLIGDVVEATIAYSSTSPDEAANSPSSAETFS